MQLSKKQAELIKKATARVNIFEGAKRSGKTHCGNILFPLFVAHQEEQLGNARFLIAGKTQDSAETNMVGPIERFYGEMVRYKKGKLRILGCYCDVLGANDDRSEAILRGRTYAGILGDEISLWPRNFWDTSLGQMSETGAKFFGSTNPDSPYHYLKTDFIDQADGKEISSSHWLMSREYNPVLDPAYIKSMHRIYKGSPLFYKRMVLGEWTQAEGLIFEGFSEQYNVIGKLPVDIKTSEPVLPTRKIVAIDYGTNNPCTFGKYYYYRDTDTVILKDYYWWDSQTEHKQKTDADYVKDFKKFVGEDIVEIVCDPSALSFITALEQAGYRVNRANNDVKEGIGTLATYIGGRKFLVLDHCKEDLREFSLYSWDDKAQARGEDKPLKVNDHAMDRNRYMIMFITEHRPMSDEKREQFHEDLPV